VQFLAPLWLALAGAAAVPLLLHLLRRRAGVRVPFPAARYLARAEQEHSARVRLRNWLLLALRVLALVCVALAAARPLVGGGAGGRAPAALAVVLDNSASSSLVAGGRPVLDALREQALAALDRAGTRDRVWLVTAGGQVTGGGVEAARAAARAAPALAGAGDLPAAVDRAAALAGGAGLGPGAVVVVTDGQAAAWTRPVRTGAGRVAVVSPGTPAPADRAVLDAAAVPSRWSPAGDVTGQLSAPGDWQAVLDDGSGRTVATARGVADAAGARVRVTLRPDARGWLAGALRVAPDEWRASDARHFAVLVADPPAAVADASAGPFAEAAVAALAAAGRVRPVAGATGVRVAEPPAAGRLPAVLVAPADGARLGAANQALARLGVPWRFGALVTAPARARLRADEPAAAGARPADSLPPVAVARRWRLERVGAAVADTLADVGGDAWAVAGEGYVLLASPLDPAWTDFPVRAAFVPWLDAAVARRLAGGGRAERAAPGAAVRAPAGADVLLGPVAPGAGSDGVARPATTPVAGGSAAVPDAVGVYFWLRAGARVGALVVDPEPAELTLARLGDAELAARVGSGGRGRARVGRDGGAAAGALLEGAGRRPAAGLFAAAALLALAAEGLAARPGRRRPAAPAAPRAAARAA
jgi:hypothetical protein